MINRLLVVCTGNICRSPLAEALLRSELPELQVSSAGIGALVGHAADANAAAVAVEQGLDVGAHVARQLDQKLVVESDLILVMDHGHLKWINQQFPHARGRVFLLGHWNDGAEVPDPYGHSLASFRKAYELLWPFAQSWVKRLGGAARR